MFSLRFILFAAAAFASLASAVPFASEGLIAREALPANVDQVVRNVADLKKRVYRGPSVGDYFQSCHNKVAPLVVEIKATVAVKGFNRNNVAGLINDIVVLIKALIVDIQAIAKLDPSLTDLLYLGGEPCDMNALGAVVYALLAIIIEVLALVLGLVGSLDITLTSIIFSVGVVLIELVTIVVQLVVGLDVVLAGLLKALVDPISALHCDAIWVLLNVYVK